jgi:hypothetical protein
VTTRVATPTTNMGRRRHTARREAAPAYQARRAEMIADVGPPHVLTKALIGMANWTQRWYRFDGEVTEAEIAQTFAHTFLRGIPR